MRVPTLQIFISPVTMKLRLLAASISSLMAGERAGIFKAISNFLPESQTFSFQFQRFKSSKGLLFKECNDDDDFSDLGPPVERALGKLKLATEKRNIFVKLGNDRKVSSGKSPRSESKQCIKDRIVTLDKPHQTSDDASATNTTSDDAKTNGWKSISVGDVPSTISLSQLVDAVSVFGKICSASVRDLPDGLNCWDIEFESLVSCNRAVRAGSLAVGSFCLPIRPLRASKVVTIRIKGISKDASFREMHSICTSVGTTEGLAWLSKDSLDALFTVENDTESQSILKKLNGSSVGGHRLSASLLPNSSSASMSENESARCEMALQISSYLTEIKCRLENKKVHTEDLQMLHEGIMHLEDLPTTVDLPNV